MDHQLRPRPGRKQTVQQVRREPGAAKLLVKVNWDRETGSFEP